MPLVAHTKLPTFNRLRDEGQTILTPDRAISQDFRELHVGLLNMMPDAAMAATERQFLRLVGQSNQIAQIFVHPFTIPELARGPEALDHIAKHYETFADVQRDGLDALIITGANVTRPVLAKEPFWDPLIEVIEWASENVTSTLCSCLATHAVLDFRYGQKRRHLDEKLWGVYRHRVLDRAHPLVRSVNTRFDVPHSRFNAVARSQFEAAGLHVLVESEEAGVHLAVSENLFRIVFLQGHPEYDANSLLKEYKREVVRYQNGERSYPPFPAHYLGAGHEALLDEYREALQAALDRGDPVPEFPEDLIFGQLHNTWHDTGESFWARWIGKVYQVTHSDRRKPYMDGVDPLDPLGLKS